MVRAYWLRIVVCGIIGVVLGFLVATFTPKQYEGVVQVLMPPPETLPNRADTPAAATVIDFLNFTQPRNVNTQVESLTSLGVIGAAAQKVAQRYNLPMTQGTELYPLDLMEKVNITAATGSDLVTLRVRASSPSLARDIAGEMYLAFADEGKQMSTEFGNRAISSLETQIAIIDQQVRAIDKKLEDARDKYHAPNVEGKITQDLAQERDLEQASYSAKQNASAQSARAAGLQTQIDKLDRESMGSKSTGQNPQYETLVHDINSSESDREAMLTKYLPENEQVVMLDGKIKAMKAKLKTMKPTIELGKSAQLNPIRSNLLSELASSLANIKAANEQGGIADAQLAAKRAEIAQLPAAQTVIMDYTRQQAVLERDQAAYRDQLNSLKSAGIGRRSITSLETVAQAADRPVVPNTNLNIALGLILGVATGFLWSIGTEARRNPIRSLGQLNRLALMPSYRAIPELRVPMRGLSRAPAEVFDALLVNFIRAEKKGYRLGVLGVNKSSGATTTAMNLAIAAARGGYSVLYVEVDPGNNALTKLTPAAGDIKSPGANIAIYNASLGETQTGGTVGLPADFEVAAANKDLVIFDFPPVKASGDAFLIANQLDEMVLLVRANVTRSGDFLQAQQALIDVGCPLVTITLSRVTEQMDDISALEQHAEIRPVPHEA